MKASTSLVPGVMRRKPYVSCLNCQHLHVIIVAIVVSCLTDIHFNVIIDTENYFTQWPSDSMLRRNMAISTSTSRTSVLQIHQKATVVEPLPDLIPPEQNLTVTFDIPHMEDDSHSEIAEQ